MNVAWDFLPPAEVEDAAIIWLMGCANQHWESVGKPHQYTDISGFGIPLGEEDPRLSRSLSPPDTNGLLNKWVDVVTKKSVKDITKPVALGILKRNDP